MPGLPACSEDTGQTGDQSPADAVKEEPLDPMDGDESDLPLGKADAAKRVLPAFDTTWEEYPRPSGSPRASASGSGGSARAHNQSLTVP